MGVIGGADGPTVIFVTGNLNLAGAVLVVLLIAAAAGAAVWFFRRNRKR